MAEESIYEMLWDCEYCSTKKLLGKTHRHCPNCGATQDPNRRYFPEEADKVAVLDHIYYGADKVCPFCQTANGAKATFCGNCGGSLDGSKEVVRKDLPIPGSESEADPPSTPLSAPTPQTPLWVKWMLSIIGVTLLTFFFLAIFWTEKVELKVSSHNWQRTIEIEKFKPVNDSEWCDSMPFGAYQVTRTSEVRSQRQVADGETCSTVQKDRGDGTFSESQSCTTNYRSEPVYDDRCHFMIDRWAKERTEKAEGKSLSEEPQWPVFSLNSCTSARIGCEKEGSRNESYILFLTEASGKSSGKIHECEFEQAKWKQFQIDSKYSSDKSVILDSISCDELTSISQ